MAARSWPALVREPGGERHIVQLYREPAFLVRAASEWAQAALATGGGCIFIVEPANEDLLRLALARSSIDVGACERDGRLVFIEAEAMMARFFRDGAPQPHLFAPLVRALAQDVRAACAPGAPVRAFGEMVNILWQRDEKQAARQLESMWNDVIEETDLRLLCAYRVDNLSVDTHAHHLKDICEGHSHLIPEEDPEAFDSAVANALSEVFGEADAGVIRAALARDRLMPTAMPASEAVLYALQGSQPEMGRRVIEAARGHYLAARQGGR